MSESKADKIIVGAHEFSFDPPRTVSFIMRGTFEEEHANAYNEFLSVHAGRCHEPLDGLFDLSALKAIAPSARKRVAEHGRTILFGAVAVVGASFSIRTVSSMLMRAGKIIAPKKIPFSVQFFDSVEDANAWFDTVRKDKNGI